MRHHARLAEVFLQMGGNVHVSALFLPACGVRNHAATRDPLSQLRPSCPCPFLAFVSPPPGLRLANPQAPLCSRTPDQIRSSTGAASLPPPSPGCRANRSPRSRPARLGPSRAANRRRPARPLLAESANSCVGQAWPGVRSSGGSRGSGGAKAEVAAPGPGVERS